MHDLETIKRLNNEATEKELANPGKNLEVKKFLEERRKAKRLAEEVKALPFNVEHVETTTNYTLKYRHGKLFYLEAKMVPVFLGRVVWTVFTDEFIEVTDLPVGQVAIEDIQAHLKALEGNVINVE